MRTLTYIFILVLFCGNLALGQDSYDISLNEIASFDGIQNNKTDKVTIQDKNGADFSILTTAINTKYSEIGSGLFKDKLMLVSSKQIGAIGIWIDTRLTAMDS